MNDFINRPTIGGYEADQVVSLLQKAVRRGEEELALWAASELDLSAQGARAFSRLRIMASEDVGLAERGLVADVMALHREWLERRRNKDDHAHSDRLALIHATLLLCRAKKSRLVDHAVIAQYEGERAHPEIPNWAIDMHTKAGRKLGRNYHHFWTEGAKLANTADLDDPYRERAQAALHETITEVLVRNTPPIEQQELR